MTEHDQIRAQIENAKRGDRAAFDALVGQFRDRLGSAIEQQLARRQRGDVDFEDVLQEAFLRAFEGIDRFTWRGEDSLYPWLYGIAWNVASKLAEKSARRHTLEIPERIAADDVAPSKMARRDERFDRLERSFARLKPEYREVLRLARMEGLTVKEIAERMDRTEYAVKHLLARAIKQLREIFGDTESLHLPPRSLESGNNGQ